MPASEFCEWLAYVELYGPLDYARRYDYPAALVAWMQGRTASGEVDDFLPYKTTKVDAPDHGWSETDMVILGMKNVS